MNEPLTKETIHHIESLLLSGDATNIDLGLLLAASQEMDLGEMMMRVKQLCDIFMWKGLETNTNQLLRLTQVRKLDLHIGRADVEATQTLNDTQTVGFVDNFEELPQEWAMLLPNLEKLTIGGGNVAVLPDEIGYLSNLQSLYLQDVAFKKFPPTFKNLKQLKTLSIVHPIEHCTENIPLFALPDEIGELEQLENLHIESCLLSFIPEQIRKLTALRTLYINCDPEALCKSPELYKKFRRRKDNPEALHFVPDTLSVLPRLEMLTLLLPSRHFPLSEALFQNSHLRHLQLSARLVTQLPLQSKELGRLTHLEVFKPTLLQQLHLTFALPDTVVEPMQHRYAKSVFWYNIILLLLYLPVGVWYFASDLLVNQLLLPPSKGYVPALRYSLALLLYPIAFIIFTLGTLYWGVVRFIGRPKK